MTASALADAQMQWYLADPRISEEHAPLLASAFSAESTEEQRKYATTRLGATKDGAQALEAITAAFSGDGNSYINRRMRAMRQLRNRLGQFAYQGGGARVPVRTKDGSNRWLTGTVVGATASSNTYDIQTPKGIVRVPASSVENVEAYLPGKTKDGFSPVTARLSAADASDIIDEGDLQYVDSPDGWVPVDNFQGNPGEKAFSDGVYTVAQTDNEDGSKSYRLIDENGDEVAKGDSWASMLDESAKDALGGAEPSQEISEDMLITGLDEIANNETAGAMRKVAGDVAAFLRDGTPPSDRTPEQLAEQAKNIADVIDRDKEEASPNRKFFDKKFQGFEDDFRKGAEAITKKLGGQEIQQDRKEEKQQPIAKITNQPTTAVEVPQGAYELEQGEYTPSGRVTEDSPDFTDDPVTLANKFEPDDIFFALQEALIGTDPSRVNGLGYGGLNFKEGIEEVPAEALYAALEEQGEDADKFVAETYAKGQARLDGTEEPDVTDEQDTIDEIKGEDVADALDRVKKKDSTVDINTADEESEEEDPNYPALIEGLTEDELQSWIDSGYDHTPFLPKNEEIEFPEGYGQLDVAPISLTDEVDTVEEGDELNQDGVPVGWTDDPYVMAQKYDTDDLIADLEASIQPRDEDNSDVELGFALFNEEDENGDTFSLQVSARNIRDALQLQGEDTNALLQEFADRAWAAQANRQPTASDVEAGRSSGDPTDEEIQAMLDGEGITPGLDSTDTPSGTITEAQAEPEKIGEPNAERASRLNARADELTATGDTSGAAVYRLRAHRDGEAVRLYTSAGEGNVSLPVGNVETANSFTPSAEATRLMQEGGITPLTMHELKSSPENVAIFNQAINDAKNANEHGASVYVYSPEEYADMRMFLSPDGKSGFALKGSDLVSVFKGETQDKRVAHAMVPLAIQEGAITGDAFDTVLPKIYGDHGLKTVARLPWDDSQAPSDWSKETFSDSNNGEPDVIFMAYDPEDTAGYTDGQGEMFSDYDDAVNSQQRFASGKQGPLSPAGIPLSVKQSNLPFSELEFGDYIDPAEFDVDVPNGSHSWYMGFSAGDAEITQDTDENGITTSYVTGNITGFDAYGNEIDRTVVVDISSAGQKFTTFNPSSSKNPNAESKVTDSPEDVWGINTESNLSSRANTVKFSAPVTSMQPGDITIGDNFTITEVGTEPDSRGKISVKGYFPGSPIQEKFWKNTTPIDFVRGIPAEDLPMSGNLPEIHKPQYGDFRGGSNSQEFKLAYAKWRGMINAARGRWTNRYDVASYEFSPDKDIHRVKVHTNELKPGDILADATKGNFVIVSVSDPNPNNPEHADAIEQGLLIVMGYYPGHELQEKKWKPRQEGRNGVQYKMEVIRNSEIPDSGPLPALSQGEVIDGRYVYNKDPEFLKEYKQNLATAASLYNFPSDAPEVDYPQEINPALREAPRPVPTREPKPPFEVSDPFAQGAFAEMLRQAGSWENLREAMKGMTFTFFDYETTGLNPNLENPVQLGAVKIKDGVVVDRFDMYINPGSPLGDWSKDNLKNKDGDPLTDEFLQQQASMAEAHQAFADWVGADTILGAMNSNFDREFLEIALSKTGVEFTPTGYIDPQSFARAINADAGEPNRKVALKLLAEQYGVPLENWHSADADAEATASIFGKLLDRAQAENLANGQFDVDAIAAKHLEDLEFFDTVTYPNYLRDLEAWNMAKAVKDALAGKEVDVDQLISDAKNDNPTITPDSAEDIAGTQASKDSAAKPARLGKTEWVLDDANTRPIDREDVRVNSLEIGDFMSTQKGDRWSQVVGIEEVEDGKFAIHRVDLESGDEFVSGPYWGVTRLDGIRRPISANSLSTGEEGDSSLTDVIEPSENPAPRLEHSANDIDNFNAETTVEDNGDGTLTAITKVFDENGDLVGEQENTVDSIEEAQTVGDNVLRALYDDIIALSIEMFNSEKDKKPTREEKPSQISDVTYPTQRSEGIVSDKDGVAHKIIVMQMPKRHGGGYEIGVFKDDGSGNWVDAQERFEGPNIANFQKFETLEDAKSASEEISKFIQPVVKTPKKPTRSKKQKQTERRSRIQDGAYLEFDPQATRRASKEGGDGEWHYNWVNPDGTRIPLDTSDPEQGKDRTIGRVFGQPNSRVVEGGESIRDELSKIDIEDTIDIQPEISDVGGGFGPSGTPMLGRVVRPAGHIKTSEVSDPSGRKLNVELQLGGGFEGDPEHFNIIIRDPEQANREISHEVASSREEAEELFESLKANIANGTAVIASSPYGQDILDTYGSFDPNRPPSPTDSSPYVTTDMLPNEQAALYRVIGEKPWQKYSNDMFLYADGTHQARIGDRVIHQYKGWRKLFGRDRGVGTIRNWEIIDNPGDKARIGYAYVTFEDGSWGVFATDFLFLQGRSEDTANPVNSPPVNPEAAAMTDPPVPNIRRPFISTGRRGESTVRRLETEEKYTLVLNRGSGAGSRGAGGGTGTFITKVVPYVSVAGATGQNAIPIPPKAVAKTREAYNLWLERRASVDEYRKAMGLPELTSRIVTLANPGDAIMAPIWNRATGLGDDTPRVRTRRGPYNTRNRQEADAVTPPTTPQVPQASETPEDSQSDALNQLRSAVQSALDAAGISGTVSIENGEIKITAMGSTYLISQIGDMFSLDIFNPDITPARRNVLENISQDSAIQALIDIFRGPNDGDGDGGGDDGDGGTPPGTPSTSNIPSTTTQTPTSSADNIGEQLENFKEDFNSSPIAIENELIAEWSDTDYGISITDITKDLEVLISWDMQTKKWTTTAKNRGMGFFTNIEDAGKEAKYLLVDDSMAPRNNPTPIKTPMNSTPIPSRFIDGESVPQGGSPDGSVFNIDDSEVPPQRNGVKGPDGKPVTAQQFIDRGWSRNRAEAIARAGNTRPSAKYIYDLIEKEASTPPGQGSANLDEKIREAVKQVFGKNIKISGDYRIDEMYVDYENSGNGYLEIQYEIKDKDGLYVGEGVRNITGFEYAYNSSLSIRADHQRKGIASAINEYMENWYIANGIKYLDVEASASSGRTGALVWALNGFNWQTISGGVNHIEYFDAEVSGFSSPELKMQLERIKQKAADSLGMSWEDVVDRKWRNLNEIPEGFPTPLDLTLIGWDMDKALGNNSWIGAEIMETKSWDGRKNLTPDSIETKQKQAYNQLKKAREMASSGENAVKPSWITLSLRDGKTYSDGLGTVLAPYSDEIAAWAGSEEKSVSRLSPPAKIALNRYVSELIASGDYSEESEDADNRSSAKSLNEISAALQSDRIALDPDAAKKIVLNQAFFEGELNAAPASDKKLSPQDWKDKQIEEIKDSLITSILADLENGVVPWQKGWTGRGSFFPVNVSTGNTYSGINLFILAYAQQANGFNTNRWVGKKQGEGMGGALKEGAEPTDILVYKPGKKIVKKDKVTGEETEFYTRGVSKFVQVYNVDQFDGLNLPEEPEIQPVPISEAEGEILRRYVDHPPIEFINMPTGDSPHYIPSDDKIVMPKREQYGDDQARFIETLLHELAHSTGHKSRLDRSELFDQLGIESMLGHQTSRATEELIAQMSAAMLAAKLGVEIDVANTSAYVKSWLTALQNDKDMIFKAAGYASNVVDYIFKERDDKNQTSGSGTSGDDSSATPETDEPNLGEYGKTSEEIAKEKEQSAQKKVSNQSEALERIWLDIITNTSDGLGPEVAQDIEDKMNEPDGEWTRGQAISFWAEDNDTRQGVKATIAQNLEKYLNTVSIEELIQASSISSADAYDYQNYITEEQEDEDGENDTYGIKLIELGGGGFLNEYDYGDLIDTQGLTSGTTTVAEVQRRLEKMKAEGKMRFPLAVVGTDEAESLVRQAAISNLIQQWSNTSNNNNANSHAIQATARKEFNLTETAKWVANTEELTRDLEEYGENLSEDNYDTYSQFLRGQYEETQKFFEDRGIETLTVYRGSGVGSPSDTEVITRPLSSWSTDFRTAAKFADGNQEMYDVESVIYRAEVPVSSVLSTSGTGFGALPEYEVVLLGGKISVSAISNDEFSGFDDMPEEEVTKEIETLFGKNNNASASDFDEPNLGTSGKTSDEIAAERKVGGNGLSIRQILDLAVGTDSQRKKLYAAEMALDADKTSTPKPKLPDNIKSLNMFEQMKAYEDYRIAFEEWKKLYVGSVRSPLGEEKLDNTIKGAAAYIDAVINSDWFIEKFGDGGSIGQPKVKKSSGRRFGALHALGFKSNQVFVHEIRITPDYYSHERTLLHEIAHYATDASSTVVHAGHDKEFASNYLEILRNVIGLEHAMEQAEFYREEGVSFEFE